MDTNSAPYTPVTTHEAAFAHADIAATKSQVRTGNLAAVGSGTVADAQTAAVDGTTAKATAIVRGTIDTETVTLGAYEGLVDMEAFTRGDTDGGAANGMASGLATPRPVQIPYPSALCIMVDDGIAWPLGGTLSEVNFSTAFDGKTFATYCSERGVPVTESIVPSYLLAGTVPAGSNPAALTLANIQTLERACGWEIANHGYSHSMDTLANWMTDMRQGKAWIESQFGLSGVCRSFILPGASQMANTKAKREGAAGRIARATHETGSEGPESYHQSLMRPRHFAGRTSMVVATYPWDGDATAIDFVDNIANTPGNIGVIFVHVPEIAYIATEITNARLKLLIDAAVAWRDKGKLALVTYSTACTGVLAQPRTEPPVIGSGALDASKQLTVTAPWITATSRIQATARVAGAAGVGALTAGTSFRLDGDAGTAEGTVVDYSVTDAAGIYPVQVGGFRNASFENDSFDTASDRGSRMGWRQTAGTGNTVTRVTDDPDPLHPHCIELVRGGANYNSCIIAGSIQPPAQRSYTVHAAARFVSGGHASAYVEVNYRVNDDQPVNKLDFTGTATDGTFTISLADIDGTVRASDPIAYNVSNADLKTALIHLLTVHCSYVGASVTIASGPCPNDTTWTWEGTCGSEVMPVPTVDGSALVGATLALTQTSGTVWHNLLAQTVPIRASASGNWGWIDVTFSAPKNCRDLSVSVQPYTGEVNTIRVDDFSLLAN